MELIEDESLERAPLAEPEPRYHTEVLPISHQEHGQTWLRTLAGILIGLVLVVLIVLFARWIYHSLHHTASTGPNNGTYTVTEPSNNTSKTQAPATSTPSNSSTSTSQTPTSNSTQTLPNNGPGDVAAIFAGVTLAAAGLHYIVTARRFANDV